MKALHYVTFSLALVGALNLGLSAVGFNVVEIVLGGLGLVQIFNILAGLSAVYIIATHKSDCRVCGGAS